MELKNKKGVEIFSVGTWNGDKYTEADLDEMVRAFQETSATWKPPLKLGHDDEQELLQKDGYPAAGWIGNVYRKGKKLFADFVDIPAKIFELIERGGYKKVSSEIYWDITIGGEEKEKSYSRMLAGVALLGADMPAVMNLSDIMAWYIQAGTQKKSYANLENHPSLKTYDFSLDNQEAPTMDEKEIQKLKDEKAAAEREAQEFKAYKAKQEEERKALDSELAALRASKAKAELDAQVARIAETSEVSPAMKPYIALLIGADKKEYSLKIGKGEKAEEKKFADKGEILVEVLKLHAQALDVNFDEESVDGEEIPQSGEADKADKAIREYMAKNKCSYSAAYKAVMSDFDADEGEEE